VKCQAEDEDELDDDEAEIDSMLIENAGDILPTLAQILGGDVFSPFFSAIMPELTKKTKKSASVPERSFAVGVFAETVEKMGSASVAFVGRLYPIFTNMATDEDEEVRNNAIYGLGVLAANGGPEAFSKYTHILKLLTQAMATETDERVRDNVCGAVCRMISANPTAVAINEYLPTILARLPLKTDLEENETVMRCVGNLYTTRHEQVKRVLRLSLSVFSCINDVVYFGEIRSCTRPSIVHCFQF